MRYIEKLDHAKFMKLALAQAANAAAEGNAPFGVIVTDLDGNVLWADHDRVRSLCDPTAHGELNAIRALCRRFQKTKLDNTIFFTTSEPCPTCFSAMVRTHVHTSVFGAEIESEASLPIPTAELASRSRHRIHVIGGILGGECRTQRAHLSS